MSGSGLRGLAVAFDDLTKYTTDDTLLCLSLYLLSALSALKVRWRR
jgi:hypothetical protein